MRWMSLLLLCGALAGPVLNRRAVAAEPVPIEGTFTVQGHTYRLKHALAFEAPKSEGDDIIGLVASNRPIAVRELADAERMLLFQPHVYITFDRKTGKVLDLRGSGDGRFELGEPKGEFKLEKDRYLGAVTYSDKDQTREDHADIDLKFNLPLTSLTADAEEKETADSAGFAELIAAGLAEREAQGQIGRYTVVALPDRVMKFDTRTGEGWLLKAGTKDQPAEWIPIREPVKAETPPKPLKAKAKLQSVEETDE